MSHTPVLLHECMKILDPKPGEFMIDGTMGEGGHTRELQERVGPSGRVLAIDWEKTGENYADLPDILKRRGLPKADGLLLDLGFSSEQLGKGKGFSFMRDEPLLMTYSSDAEPVHEILERVTEEELTDILRRYGEERFARRIAHSIKSRLPIATTGKLTAAITAVTPRSYEHGRINPATRTFMALRIYANRELENLQTVLGKLPRILRPGGRVAIISFHSLEDRIVKNIFREFSKSGKAGLVTKKPIGPTDEEVRANPRARSAKLRGIVIKDNDDNSTT